MPQQPPSSSADNPSADNQLPTRLLSFKAVAALGLAALGLALLPYVLIGVLSLLMLPTAAFLARSVAFNDYPEVLDSRFAGELIAIGLVMLAVSTATLTFDAMSFVRPDDFDAPGNMLLVWGVLAVCAPTLITIGMRARSGLDEGRALDLWIYWFSYVPVSAGAGVLMSLTGWGTSL